MKFEDYDVDIDVDIDSEKLISLIKDQPTFYLKSAPPLDPKEKRDLWFSLCKELVPSWEERPQIEQTQIGLKVFSRWKSLRTSFCTEYHLRKEESKSDHRQGGLFIQKKRKKYEFYDQLLFLLPTVKMGSPKSNSPEESVPKERIMTSRAVSPIVFEDQLTSPSLKIPGIYLPSIQISRVGAGQAAQPTGPVSYPIAPGQPAQLTGPVSHPIAPGQPAHPTGPVSHPIAPGQPAQPTGPVSHPIAPGQPAHPAHPFAPGHATPPVPPCQAAQQNVPRPLVDEDRHFLLSILPALQRMSRSQKLKAKMKFLQAISDVDDETRETLQRYICFSRHASDQDYNLPEPFTGGVPVRPFVMQADHTYYLVREKGNKRARMRHESADTDPNQKFETGLVDDYDVIDNLPETAEDARSDESVEFGSLQQTGTGNLQENLEMENVQETVEVGDSQESFEVEGTQVTVVVETSKNTVEDGNVNKTDEVDSKKTVVDGNSQKKDKIGNVQVPAEVEAENLEDDVKVFTMQENFEPMDIAVAKDEFMLEAV